MNLRRSVLIVLNALVVAAICAMNLYDPSVPERPPAQPLTVIEAPLPDQPQGQPRRLASKISPFREAAASQDDRIRLVGVMLESGRSSAWVRQGSRTLRRIMLGDELDGGRLIAISRRSIIIDAAGKEREYLLDPPQAKPP